MAWVTERVTVALMTPATLALVLAEAAASTFTMNSVELATTRAAPAVETTVAFLPTRAQVSVFWTSTCTVPPTAAFSAPATETEMGRSLASFWAAMMTSPSAVRHTPSATSAL